MIVLSSPGPPLTEGVSRLRCTHDGACSSDVANLPGDVSALHWTRCVRARPLARELFAVATARTSVLYLCDYHSCRRSSGSAGLHWSDRWEGLSCVIHCVQTYVRTVVVLVYSDLINSEVHLGGTLMRGLIAQVRTAYVAVVNVAMETALHRVLLFCSAVPK